jgi:NAD(P)H dehydrogenase (quinone)
MPARISIIFYSMYGHVYRLARAVEEGAKGAGAEVKLCQVRETLADEILQKMGALGAKKEWENLPIATNDDLKNADAIILGTGTRYGASTAQMQSFLDATGSLWSGGALIGKLGSAFTSTASQHGGQETTLVHLHTFFLHQGMAVCGVPYAAKELLNLEEITGGTPYGASTIAGPRGERQPTANELAIARFQGKHVATLATKLAAKSSG